ncbi:GGDEF domain-containing protein [Thiobaca trueperi]|uniref:diguanylate cyclase n=1 Tax=Thiobaca trueperi TaxID=127458 RepID=A0A4R3N0F0_9GAMM|nr:sensor domain-containing diguanylate cyclase [Thiobaca trueperi]TCT22235.1 diguanylate cyclase (GGDEF)-like protein [Thiobaca trueperi]
MTKTAFARHRRSLKFERNLALIFGLLGLTLAIVIALHWFLVLKPTLRAEAESRASALAQAQAQSIERLLGSGLPAERLRNELQTTLDGMLLIKDQSTREPFIEGIALTIDYDLFDAPGGNLDLVQGRDDCAECFVAHIPLYHPQDRLLIGIATCYSNPAFLEQLLNDVRVNLLWVGVVFLCLISFAWWETDRLLRRLRESESNLRSVFEAAPFPMVLNEDGQLGLRQANRAAKAYLDLREDGSEHFSSELWLTLYAAGLPTDVSEPRETPIPAADGTPRWALVSAIPLQFSGVPSQLISLADVTELKTIQDELRSASLTDGLTNIYNRRYLYLRLTKEVDLVKRYHHPLSIFLFDLDHFKQVNDTFGHGVGDEVLIQVASALKGCLREVDVAGRYGGEEFLVILPHASAPEALEVAERIGAVIKSLQWSQPALRVTISGGVQQYKGEELDEFVELADRKLYQAKTDGRDRVVG